MSERRPSPLPAKLELAAASAHPDSIEPQLELEHQYKLDWLSAVGLYRSSTRSVILKCYRARSLWGVPVRWVTRLMAARESRILELARGVPGVPETHGTWNEVGLIHEFLEGHPLRPGESVREDFFQALDARLAAIHERGLAYVDLSKRDNILVGEDGMPCLIDFQIAWVWPTTGWFGRFLPGFVGRWILARLQRADLHHVLKHRSRVAPETLTDEQRAALSKPAFPIRVHRFLVRPYQKWRRRRQGLSA